MPQPLLFTKFRAESDLVHVVAVRNMEQHLLPGVAKADASSSRAVESDSFVYSFYSRCNLGQQNDIALRDVSRKRKNVPAKVGTHRYFPKYLFRPRQNGLVFPIYTSLEG